jgi:hypothetical protein
MRVYAASTAGSIRDISCQAMPSMGIKGLNKGSTIVIARPYLRHLPRPPHQQSVVGSHPGIDHPDAIGDLLDLVRGVVLVEDGLVLLLRGQDDPVGRLDADGGRAGRHRGQGVLDLDELPGRAEIRERK